MKVDWKETAEYVELEFTWRSQKRAESVMIVDWFVRVNVLGEGVEAVDLHGQVDSDEAHVVDKPGLLRVQLRKKNAEMWRRLRANKDVDKAKRREEGMEQHERREKEKEQSKVEEKQRKEKASEQHTWREEAERKADIDKWKNDIKKHAIDDLYAQFTHTSVNGIVSTYTEDSVPEVRGQGKKIGLNFTTRVVLGVPAREKRDEHKTPMPVLESKSSEGVWEKEKGDKFMTSGDYKAAYLAYSEGLLKEEDNVRILANRAVASIYLSRVSVGLADIQKALSILARKRYISEEEEFVRVNLLMRASQCELMLGNIKAAARYLNEADKTSGGVRLLKTDERECIARDKDVVEKAVEYVSKKKQADRLYKDGLFNEAAELYMMGGENAVIMANVGLCRMQGGQGKGENVEALRMVKSEWSVEDRKPVNIGKILHRRQVLDRCPSLEDPTVAEGKDEWLMRQEGVEEGELPAIPSDWEWVRDAKETSNWIAKKRRLTASERKAVERKMTSIREVCEGKDVAKIRQLAQEIAETDKLQKTAEQMMMYANELENLSNDEAHKVERGKCSRFGLGSSGFVSKHMVQTTRLRLAAKIIQRLESLGVETDCKREVEVLLSN